MQETPIGETQPVLLKSLLKMATVTVTAMLIWVVVVTHDTWQERKGREPVALVAEATIHQAFGEPCE